MQGRYKKGGAVLNYIPMLITSVIFLLLFLALLLYFFGFAPGLAEALQ